MTTAVLYLPQAKPKVVELDESSMRLATDDLALALEPVASLLGCKPGLVDILAKDVGYVVFSVFDYEGGEINVAAMDELNRLTGYQLDALDDDQVLYGPLLLVTMD
jgi:hypothetical protein